MTELKPCPFCGGEAYDHAGIIAGGKKESVHIICEKCGAKIYGCTEQQAIAAWNTRADDYRQAAEYWQRMYEQSFTERTCRDKGNIERFICSECGCRLIMQDDDWEPTMFVEGAAMEPRFCPNCGARVVE